jgi:hypothetical protein
MYYLGHRIFGLDKIKENPWLAWRFSAAQEGLCSV